MKHKLRRIWEKNWPEIHCDLRGGLPSFLWSPNPPSPSDDVPVFCYHIPDAESFRADLEHLRRNGYQTLIPDQLLAHLNGTEPAPPKAVVLTFDDGSVEVYRTAFPLLKEYGFRAVAFIAPSFHDGAPEGTDQGRACTWDELAEMHASGVIDVQSHTLEHRLMRRWPEPAPICGVVNGPHIAPPTTLYSMREDFRLAKALIESRLGNRVRHLCFPCYDGTTEAIEAARSVGYESFWWGVLPRVPDNRPAENAAHHIVRVSDEFLRRLPGDGRVSLVPILRARYGHSFRRLRNSLPVGAAQTE